MNVDVIRTRSNCLKGGKLVTRAAIKRWVTRAVTLHGNARGHSLNEKWSGLALIDHIARSVTSVTWLHSSGLWPIRIGIFAGIDSQRKLVCPLKGGPP